MGERWGGTKGPGKALIPLPEFFLGAKQGPRGFGFPGKFKNSLWAPGFGGHL